MAFNRYNQSHVSRGKGHSAIGKASYNSREVLKDERLDQTFHYKNASEDLIHSEIVAPHRAQDWTRDREQLWNKAEASEKQKNSRSAINVNLVLPRELSDQQNIELVRDFIHKAYTSKGMVADFAIHKSKASDGGENPHAHILLSTRPLDGENFSSHKARQWTTRPQLQKWRTQWSQTQNQHLEKHGHDVRVDHRSYKDQGKDKIPQEHLGPKAKALEDKGIKTEKARENRLIDHKNKVNDYNYGANKQNLNEINKLNPPVSQKQVVEKHDSKAVKHSKMLSNYLQSTIKPSMQVFTRIREFAQNIKDKTADLTRSVQEKIKTGFAERVKNERKNAPAHSNADDFDVAGNSIITRGR